MKTSRKGIMFIIAGIIVVVLGVLVVGRLVQSMLIPAATPPPATPVKESVLVTARGIPLGTVFGPADLTTIQLPVELVPLNRLTDPNQAVGKVAMAPLVAGEMVLPHRLAEASNVVDRTLAVDIADDQVLLAFPILDLMSQLNILKKGDVVVFVTLPATIQTGAGGEGESKTFTFDAMQRVTLTAIIVDVVAEGAPAPTPAPVQTPGARVSVPESILYPREYNATNVGGTVSLMEAMRDVGVKRVVLASSGAIYGEQDVQPLREGQGPKPRSPYAVSKLAAEYYVRTIGSLWGIETVALRIFNAYGPGQHLPPSQAPVVPYFLKQASRGGSLVLHGDGSQTRDYVYVDDVISAMMAAATAPGINGLVINVGSGTETSVRDLARLVLKVTGSESNLVANTQTSGGVTQMCANIALAEKPLNYKPSFSLEDRLLFPLLWFILSTLKSGDLLTT